MEAAECGAASLAMILGHHGLHVSLEELRVACGVSRDGSNANNILKAARNYGLEAKGLAEMVDRIHDVKLPAIIFWQFGHFMVLDEVRGDTFFINDPGGGRLILPKERFTGGYSGVVLTCSPGPDFKPSGTRPGLVSALRERLGSVRDLWKTMVLASLILALPVILIPAIARVFVDDYLVRHFDGWIPVLLAGLFFTAIMRGLVTGLTERFISHAQTRSAMASSARLFWHLLCLPVEFFVQRFRGEIAERLDRSEELAETISGAFLEFVREGILVVCLLVVMCFYDLLLTGFALLTVALVLVLSRLGARKRFDLARKLDNERERLSGVSVSGLEMIESMRTGGTENIFFSGWSAGHARVVSAEQELEGRANIEAVMAPLLTSVNTLAILVLGSLQVMDGVATMGMLVAFQSLVASFSDSSSRVAEILDRLVGTQHNLECINDVLSYKPDVEFLPERESSPEGMGRLVGGVEIKGLTYGYNRNKPPLIEGFDLVLAPGEAVALVGSTGSGRSTIVRILAGLYQPWEGEILFDGTPRGAIPRETFHRSLAMVDQDLVFFEGSVIDNLTFWDRSIPKNLVVGAAQDAVIHEDISARSGGYESHLSAGGRNFSLGQRQRLEIARALIRNPALLILDEATSTIAPLTEGWIIENIRRRGCTTIHVTHRLSTVRHVDRVVVIEEGKVVERGSFDDLAGGGGSFQRLFGISLLEGG